MLLEPESGGELVGKVFVGLEAAVAAVVVGWTAGVGTTVELGFGGGMLAYESTKMSS